LEAFGIRLDTGEESTAARARHPLSFVAHDREIVGIWLPPHLAPADVARVVSGDAQPGAGEARRRAGSHMALVHPDAPLEKDLRPFVDLVLVDATGRELTLDTWVRLATERAHGASIVVLTHAVADAYRCDRVVLALWSISELLSALDSLVEEMQAATRDLIANTSPPRRAAVLAVELQRGNRAVRDLIDLARRLARVEEDRLRLQDLAGGAASLMLDERVLEKLIAEAEGL
jgi:hypothetical protein